MLKYAHSAVSCAHILTPTPTPLQLAVACGARLGGEAETEHPPGAGPACWSLQEWSAIRAGREPSLGSSSHNAVISLTSCLENRQILEREILP